MAMYGLGNAVVPFFMKELQRRKDAQEKEAERQRKAREMAVMYQQITGQQLPPGIESPEAVAPLLSDYKTKQTEKIDKEGKIATVDALTKSLGQTFPVIADKLSKMGVDWSKVDNIHGTFQKLYDFTKEKGVLESLRSLYISIGGTGGEGITDVEVMSQLIDQKQNELKSAKEQVIWEKQEGIRQTHDLELERVRSYNEMERMMKANELKNPIAKPLQYYGQIGESVIDLFKNISYSEGIEGVQREMGENGKITKGIKIVSNADSKLGLDLENHINEMEWLLTMATQKVKIIPEPAPPEPTAPGIQTPAGGPFGQPNAALMSTLPTPNIPIHAPLLPMVLSAIPHPEGQSIKYPLGEKWAKEKINPMNKGQTGGSWLLEYLRKMQMNNMLRGVGTPGKRW